uniref:ATP synthase subunit a n=1 Tax=Geotrichum candidum TaxID=1173061 RepID=A0A0A1I5A1_GEOCN|nr:ATPase subunit 6 [Geotrichum candidum]CDI44093.1 ATPase subunit 6 [Geotrichum candidum]
MNKKMNMMMNSPLEQFEMNTYFTMNSSLMNMSGLSLTNFGMYSMMIFSMVLGLHTLTTNNNGMMPSRWSMGIEALYSTMQSMVKNQMGMSGQYYFPLMYVLFVFMLMSNLFSMMPYNFALMSHLVFTVSLSAMMWLGVTMLGFYNYRLEYFGLFVPQGTSLPLVPVLVLIELMSNMARSMSLGLRLGANMLSGHLLMVMLGGLMFDFMSTGMMFFMMGFLPLGLVLGMMSLECAMAMMQAYVFSMLACSYIKEAMYTH